MHPEQKLDQYVPRSSINLRPFTKSKILIGDNFQIPNGFFP